MKRIYCCLLAMLFLTLVYVPRSRAQNSTSVDVGLGFGTMSDSSNGSGIDNANSLNAFGSCSPGPADLDCQTTPSLGGFFMGFGGDVMLTSHYGLGGEVDFQPSKSDYGPVQYRQLFYDFDGLYVPMSSKRASLRLLGGIGGSRTSFTIPESACVGTAVCTSEDQSIGSSGHFQIHLGVGVQVLVTDHLFIRPQFDFHYVPGFASQFGRDTVPGVLIWVGYNFGG